MPLLAVTSVKNLPLVFADAFDGALHIDGYAIEGFNDKNETASIPLSSLFAHIPAAVLEARSIAAKVPEIGRAHV